tara:strand:+ start:86 stop:508 length:423 start_codon:yes stop_codon:yes gene_type:complete
MDYQIMYAQKCQELEHANGIIQYYTEWYTQYSDDINLAEMSGLETKDGAEITMRRIAGDYVDKIKYIDQLEKNIQDQNNKIKLLNNQLLEYVTEIKNTYNKYIQLKTDNERKTKDLKDLHSMILEWDKIIQSGNIDVVKI